MNQKGFVHIILLIIIVALVGAGAYFVLPRQVTPPTFLLKARGGTSADRMPPSYLIVIYDISYLDLNSLKHDTENFKKGDGIIVKLEKADNFYKASSVAKQNVEEPYIKGVVSGINRITIYKVKSDASKEYEFTHRDRYTDKDSLKVGDEVTFQADSIQGNEVGGIRCINGNCSFVYGQNPPPAEITATVTGIKEQYMELVVDYGLERRFIPKGYTGFGEKNLLVEITLNKGKATATRLLIGDKFFDFK